MMKYLHSFRDNVKGQNLSHMIKVRLGPNESSSPPPLTCPKPKGILPTQRGFDEGFSSLPSCRSLLTPSPKHTVKLSMFSIHNLNLIALTLQKLKGSLKIEFQRGSKTT